MRRDAVPRRRRHYLCRWAPGIRTRDSLSMLVRPVHKTTPGPRSIGHNLTCFRILPCRTSDAPGPRDGEAPERDRARTVSPTPPALSSSTARFKNPAGGDGFYNIFQERGIVVGWLAVGGMQRWMHRRRAEACGNLSNQANGGQRKIKIVFNSQQKS
jgi:hypothetical protein